MAPSAAALDLISQFEGFRGSPYLCPAGVPTIGYGHTRGVQLSDPPVSREQARLMLEADVEAFWAEMAPHISQPIRQHQADALVSFAYNVGVGAFRQSTLLRKLNAGDIGGAAAEFARWNKGGGKVLPGLVARREAERRLFLGLVA